MLEMQLRSDNFRNKRGDVHDGDLLVGSNVENPMGGLTKVEEAQNDFDGVGDVVKRPRLPARSEDG